MTNTDLLNQKIKDSGLKRGYIADQLGISQFTLAKKLDNTSEFKQTEIAELRDLLKLTNEDCDKIFFAKKVDETLTLGGD